MSVQRYPRSIEIYKGENQFLINPIINHIAGYSVCSNLCISLRCEDEKGIAKRVEEAFTYIDKSPLSTVTPNEHFHIWEEYSKYQSWASFWKSYLYGSVMQNTDASYRIHSAIRAATPRQEYNGSVKVIDLPAGSTYEEVAAAVLDVFAAADEYYATHGAPDPYPRKELELLDSTVLSFRPPCDRHFEDAGDFGVGEIYQGYSYLPREDAEPSAEFFLGIATEIDCNLEPGNVKECWERTYGTAEDFKMQEVSKGIYTHYAEMKNKSVYKTSYFLQHGDDLILECGMMLHMPNRRKKLEEKLIPLIEEFAANCEKK